MVIIRQMKKVFEKSKNNVTNPNFFPNKRLTFVAPIFPDPYFLISSFFLNL